MLKRIITMSVPISKWNRIINRISIFLNTPFHSAKHHTVEIIIRKTKRIFFFTF